VLSEEQQRALLRRAMDGTTGDGQEAIQELLQDFRGPALAAIHRALATGGAGREHAEEAYQAAVLKYLESGLSRYRGEAAPRTYFVRIAINAALDLLRLLRREERLDREERVEVSLVSPIQPQDMRIQVAQERRALQECLERLPAILKEAVSLYYFEEAGDCEACAAALRAGRSAFEQRLHRGRLALADCLRRKLER